MAKPHNPLLTTLLSPIKLLGSRHHMIDLLKTLALVVPLTILIWIYAERAQTTSERVQVELDVWVNEALQWATLEEPSNGTFTIDLEGPKSKIDELKLKLSRLRVQLPRRYESNTEQTEPVAPLLNNISDIAQSGVTIKSTSPVNLKVRIEPRVEREVPLRLPDNMTVTVQNVVIDPATVKVRGPSTALDRIFPTAKSGLSVNLSSDRAQVVGPHRFEGVPIIVPNEPGLQVSPAKANSVRFEVSAEEVEYLIPSVRIVVEKPLNVDDKWRVITGAKTIPNVRVRGPMNAIAKLQPQGDNPPEIVPVAVLRLENEDAGKTDVQRAVIIDRLPPGVKLADSAKEVLFSVRDVNSPE